MESRILLSAATHPVVASAPIDAPANLTTAAVVANLKAGNGISFNVMPPTDVWTGAANDGVFSTDNNWQGGIAPVNGQPVDFPVNGSHEAIDLTTPQSVGAMSIEGDYTFTDSAITLGGSLTSTSAQAIIGCDLTLTAATMISAGSGSTLTCSSISGNYNITKSGAGTLVLSSGGNLSSYAGSITVSAGTLEADTTLGSGVTVSSGATLDGTGTAHGITSAGGTISIGTQSGTTLTMTAISTISVASGNTLTFSSISGSKNFTKSGAGTLALAGGGNLFTYLKIVTVTAGTLEVDTTFGGSVIVDAGATLDGSGTAKGITAMGGTISIAPQTGSHLILSAYSTISVASGMTLTLNSVHDAGGSFGFTKTGAGTLVLTGITPFSGSTTVTDGTLEVDTSLQWTVTVNSGTLDGSGSAHGIFGNGGTVSLETGSSPSTLTSTGNISFGSGSTLAEEIDNGSTGQLGATGSSTTIDLTDATLAISTQSDFTPSPGTVITLISNQTGNAVTGTFRYLPQDAITTIGDLSYQVSYTGGSGQDVTLTVVSTPVASALQIVRQPASSLSGEDLGTVIVNVVDSNGDLLADDNSTVTLTTSDGAPLTGTTSVQAVHGVATFSGLSIAPLGVRRLIASGANLTTPSDLIGISARRIDLADFGASVGINPQGGLAVDSQGNLYGTTTAGGDNLDGTVFEFDALTGVITTLASFDGSNGSTPIGSLLRDSAGNLYGTAQDGGANNAGTVWELAANSSSITTLASFNSDVTGDAAQSGLVMDSVGNLYGATSFDGPDGAGAVFEIVRNSGTVSVLQTFDSGALGGAPNSTMVMDAAGNLYGAAYFGGTAGAGAIFEIDGTTHAFTVLASLDGDLNGANPWGSDLAIDPSGDLFFTANSGDAETPDGALLELAAGSHAITTLAAFNSATTGAAPQSGVVMDSSGNLFGTTTTGGDNNAGTLYEFPAGGSAITVLMSFSTATGHDNYGRLAMDSNGRLYGSAFNGGANNDGTLFEYTTIPETTQVVITSQPALITQGAAQTFVLNFESAGGVTVDYAGSVNISTLSRPYDSHLGGPNSVVAEGGVASLSGISFDEAGTYTLGFYSGNLTFATTTITVVLPTWTGTAGDGVWSNPANWSNGIVGGGGSAVEFPNVGQTVTNIVVDQPEQIREFFIDGLYHFTGDTLSVAGGITVTSASAEADSLILLGDTSVTVGANETLTVDNLNDLGNNCAIFKEGTGTLTFSAGGSISYYVAIVDDGTLEVDGAINSTVYVNAGSLLTGSGTVPSIYGQGGTISLSSAGAPSQLTSSGDVSLGSGDTLQEVLSSQSGTEHDGQLIADGNITLTGSTLEISPLDGFTPAANDVITVISNHAGTAITGTFDNLPEGTLTTINDVMYRISYVGGASHADVTLTVVPTPAITSTAAVTFAVGQSDAFTVATIGISPATLSETGDLPPGITFHDNGDGTATLSGTPTAAGAYPMTLDADNGQGSSATQSFTLTVNAPMVVTNMTDAHIDDELDLREALALATGGGAVIDLPAGTIDLTGGVLTAADTGYKLTIQHTGGGTTTIDGQGNGTVFMTLVNTTTILSGITITGGQGNEGASNTSGGGILNAGTLTLNNAVITGNSAAFAGGGIANKGGILTLNNTIVSENSAAGFGGGGIANNHGTLTINNSAFINNTTPSSGAGIYMFGGTLALTNSTFSGNSALISGGGIINDTSAAISTITDSTFSNNTGGGIANDLGTVSLNGTIVTGSGSLHDLDGSFTGTRDLISDNSGTGLTSPLSGTAELVPLGFYGGITPSMPPLLVSQAIGNGGIFTAAGGLDQRGVTRSPQVWRHRQYAVVLRNGLEVHQL